MEFAEGELIEQGDGFAGGPVFAGVVGEPVLAAEAVVDAGRLGVGGEGEPVGAFPAGLGAEAGAGAGERVVQRAAAEVTAGFELPVRPGHLVVEAERFGDAVAEEIAVVGPGSEATDIDAGEVHGGLAVHQPFGEATAGAPGAGDAGGVEPGEHEQTGDLGCFAHSQRLSGVNDSGGFDEAVVAGGVEGGQAPFGFAEGFGEFGPIGGEQLEGERVGDAGDVPDFGGALEGAEHEAMGSSPRK